MNLNRRAFLMGCGTVLLSGCGRGLPPAGQPPLVVLDDNELLKFRDQFNRDATRARVILLLSPT